MNKSWGRRIPGPGREAWRDHRLVRIGLRTKAPHLRPVARQGAATHPLFQAAFTEEMAKVEGGSELAQRLQQAVCAAHAAQRCARHRRRRCATPPLSDTEKADPCLQAMGRVRAGGAVHAVGLLRELPELAHLCAGGVVQVPGRRGDAQVVGDRGRFCSRSLQRWRMTPDRVQRARIHLDVPTPRADR